MVFPLLNKYYYHDIRQSPHKLIFLWLHLTGQELRLYFSSILYMYVCSSILPHFVDFYL